MGFASDLLSLAAMQHKDLIVAQAVDVLPHYCGFMFRKEHPLLEQLNAAISKSHS